MEDTILAAYSALLIGCILQKKPVGGGEGRGGGSCGVVGSFVTFDQAAIDSMGLWWVFF